MPLGEKGRQLVGNIGEWYVERRHLQSYSLRLCRLRIEVLAPQASIERTDCMLVIWAQ
jgi:hypothetical protein